MTQIAYICHAYRADPAGNAERVRRIAEGMKHDNAVIAPHLFLPDFIDEATERHLALRHCLRLVATCDEVRVYGEPTEGMQLEIADAAARSADRRRDDGKERRPPGEPGGRLRGGFRPC